MDLTAIEAALKVVPTFHMRIMNLPLAEEPAGGSLAYRLGNLHARHAAAEIANEADALIRSLLDRLREAEAREQQFVRAAKAALEVLDDVPTWSCAGLACNLLRSSIDAATKETP